ncbi:MAG TPA: riboflavin biosynthesis protein RibF [Tepidisphaeraceae bacterium]|jgi:riboflavin kinase/FMN adenylyltransferase
MKLYDGIDGLKAVPPGTVMSIGNFDGVHLGHEKILQTMQSLKAATTGARLAVVTFQPHPLTVLRPQLAPPRLSTDAVRHKLLEAAGVDDLVVLAPLRTVLDLSAEQFWAILRDQVRPSHLVEGSSFNFGKNRGGTIDRLREWAAQSPVKLHVIDAVEVALVDLHVVQVSSSLIRWLISYGRMRDAAICLGRPYSLQGGVIRGHGRGRQIGVPTANLECADQLVPCDGVYAARCTIDGTTYPAAVSIGTTPTFGEEQRQVEAHLIGFHGDLYDRVIELHITDWLREQVKFDGVEQLKHQIAADLSSVQRRSPHDPSRQIARMSIA